MIQKKAQESKNTKEESLISNIKDTNLKEILRFLISNKIVNTKKINLNGDFENNIRQEIEESIKEKYRDIEEKFSELRKSGKDLGVLNFKLMMVPLKIRIFLATYEKKDAENVINRIYEIEKEINSLKK
jgi:hypothetical protein